MDEINDGDNVDAGSLILALFGKSLEAMGRLILLCAVGLVFGWNRYQSLGLPATVSALSHLTKSVLLPCITLTKLAASITSDSLASWYPLAIVPFAVAVVAYGVSQLILWLLFCVRPNAVPRKHRRTLSAVMTCSSMLNNSLSGPIVLASGVMASVAPYNQDVVGNTATVIGMISIYGSMMNFLQWTFGYSILTVAQAREVRENQKQQQQSAQHPDGGGVTSALDQQGADIQELLFPVSHGSSSWATRRRTPPSSLDRASVPDWSSSGGSGVSPVAAAPPARAPPSLFKVILTKAVVTPFTVSFVLGMVIGLVRPLHDFLYGPKAPLLFLSSTVAVCGQAFVPVSLFILGAKIAHSRHVFYRGKQKVGGPGEPLLINGADGGGSADDMEKDGASPSHSRIPLLGDDECPLPWSLVLLCSFVKLVLVPGFTLPVVILLYRQGWLNAGYHGLAPLVCIIEAAGAMPAQFVIVADLAAPHTTTAVSQLQMVMYLASCLTQVCFVTLCLFFLKE